MTKDSETTLSGSAGRASRPHWVTVTRDASSLVLLVGGFLIIIRAIGEGLTAGHLALLKVVTLPNLALGCFLLAVGFVLRGNLSRPASSVCRPDALIERVSEQLIGRSDDLKFLLECINSSSLVWLTGESGVGKTSLVERALLPHLRKDTFLSACFISDLGTDWITGPYDAIARALRGAAAAVSITTDPPPADPTEVISYLRTLRASTGRTPILVFDQFDDYQVRHRARFIRRGRLLSSRALCANNAFWRDIAELVRQRVVTAIFVTRDDGASWLESVRFVRPAVYHLGRLRPGLVLPFLDELTTPDLIASPDAGWTLLRRRLSQDIEADGRVLPIQLCVSIRGLIALKQLTVKSYQRIGGLAGLEAAYLSHAVTEAAAYAGLQAADIRGILLRLVDPDHSMTRSATDGQLLESGPEVRANPSRLSRALEYLSRHQFIRRRIDPTSLLNVWCLDHDYLARGIRDLDRKAHKNQLYLNASFTSYQQAATLRRRWNALLTPTAQLRLIAARLRGTVRYGHAASFALLSLLRILVSLPLLLLAGVSFAAYQVRISTEAAKLYSSVGVRSYGPYSLGPAEANALWRIAHASVAIRLGVVDLSLADEASATRFTSRASPVIQATVGLNQAQRLRVVRHTLPGCYSPQWNSRDYQYNVCATLARALDPDDDRLCSFAIDTALRASATNYSVPVPKSCAAVSITTGRRLASRLSDAFSTTNDVRRLDRLADLLATLPREAVAPFIPALVSHSVTLILSARRPADQLTLVSVLKSLDGKWGSGQAVQVSNILLDLLALQAAQGSEARYYPFEVVDTLAITFAKLTPTESATIWPRAVRAHFPTGETPDSGERALVSLARGLPADSVPPAFNEVLDAIRDMTPDGVDGRLLSTVGPLLARRLPAGQNSLVARTVALIRSDEGLRRLRVLVPTWTALSPDNRGTLPLGVCAQLGRGSNTENMSSNAEHARVLAALPSGTCVEESSRLARFVLPRLAAFSRSTEQWLEFQAASDATKKLAPQVDDTTAQQIISTLMDLLPRIAPSKIFTVADCALAFHERLSQEQVTTLYSYLVNDKQVGWVTPTEDVVSSITSAARMLPHGRLVGEFQKAVNGLSAAYVNTPNFAYKSAILRALLSVLDERDKTATYHYVLMAFRDVSRQLPAPWLDAKLTTLADTIEALGPVRATEANAIVPGILDSFSKTPAPPCATLRILLSATNLATLVEILKWPTCSPSDRQALLIRASEIVGVPFATDDSLERYRRMSLLGLQADSYSNTELASKELWLFVDWAGRHDLDVNGPPHMNPIIIDVPR